MRLFRFCFIGLAVLALFYALIWFVTAIIAEEFINRSIARLDRNGVDIKAQKQGFEGLLDFGFQYQMTDAEFTFDTYGVSFTVPGKTTAGVDLVRPLNLNVNLPEGGKFVYPLLLGDLGRTTLSADFTIDREISDFVAALERIDLNALGLVGVSAQALNASYSSGDGAFSVTGHVKGVKLQDFVKQMLDQQLPSGVRLPEQDVALSVQGRLVPADLAFDRRLNNLKGWLDNGGYLIIDTLDVPFHDLLESPLKTIIFSSNAGGLSGIFCPKICTAEACSPRFVLDNLSLVDTSVVKTMPLPTPYQGMDAAAVCAAL